MDPEGQGVRVGVASFAAWWEQQQHQLLHGRDVEGQVVGCCAGGQFTGGSLLKLGVGVALLCAVARMARGRGL